jgi:hypothetical protein
MTEELFVILCHSSHKSNNKLLRFLKRKVFGEFDNPDMIRFKNKLEVLEEKTKEGMEVGVTFGGWTLIENSLEQSESCIKEDLKVFGSKFNVKFERNREKKIREDYYARVIQKFFRYLKNRKDY